MKISWTTISSYSSSPVDSGVCGKVKVDEVATKNSLIATPTVTTTAGASNSNNKETDDGGSGDVNDGSSIVVSKGSCVRCGKVMANRMCRLCQVSSYCSKECYR